MIRIATLGTSSVTTTFVDAAAQVPGIDVATVYSRDAGRAAAFAAQHDVPDSCSDLAELLGSEQLDAVYVASPNALHAQHAHRAIDAGKHVLLEKPATPTAAEFAGLARAASAAGVVLLEGMRHIYDPGFAEIGRLAGDLGPLRRASLAFVRRSSDYDAVLAGERINQFDPEMAGGALRDLGVYPIAAMVHLFGEPRRAVGASVPVSGGADGAGAALATYEGLVVDLAYSTITASQRYCEIQGEWGTLTFDHVAYPTTARVVMLDGTVADHAFRGPANNMVHEIRRFVELVDTGGDPAPDHARTLATLRTVEAVLASVSEAGVAAPDTTGTRDLRTASDA